METPQTGDLVREKRQDKKPDSDAKLRQAPNLIQKRLLLLSSYSIEPTPHSGDPFVCSIGSLAFAQQAGGGFAELRLGDPR